MSEHPKVLYGEADYLQANVIIAALEVSGLLVSHFTDGKLAWNAYRKSKFDLCLLDENLHRKDGSELLRQIRRVSDRIPVLMTSSVTSHSNLVKAYTDGADDFIRKPLNIEELKCRINVFLKRSRSDLSYSPFYILGNIEFEYGTSTITHLRRQNNRIQKLTSKEADLLLFLVKNPDKTLLREEILYHVWGKVDKYSGRSMDVMMVTLRQVFKDNPAVAIETIHGIGFKFILPKK